MACEKQRAIDAAWADAWSDKTGAKIITDCSSSLYHSDPNGPSLSASMAGTLLNKSEFHAYLTHPKMGKLPFKATKPMSAGTLIHPLVLGKGIDDIAVLDFPNYKTKAAQEARDAASECHQTPILRADYEDAVLVAKDVRESLDDMGYSLSGISEAVVTWYEDSSLGPVKCRAMVDHLRLDIVTIFDLKTANSAHPRAIQSHISEYGYDIQESAYRSALRKLVPDSAGHEQFKFLFVETMPVGSARRSLITPCRLSGKFRAIGENRWRRAVETWAKCLRDDLWHGYADDKEVEIEPATWALRNEIDQGVVGDSFDGGL
ncbi:MAG: PD-(D/E)XK nuclease-like domain-containing protein [Acidobacteriota bacterium]